MIHDIPGIILKTQSCARHERTTMHHQTATWLCCTTAGHIYDFSVHPWPRIEDQAFQLRIVRAQCLIPLQFFFFFLLIR